MPVRHDEFIPEGYEESRYDTFELLPVIRAEHQESSVLVRRRWLPTEEEKVRQAVQAAYARGLKEGLEEARTWKNAAGNEIRTLLSSIVSERKAMLVQLEGELLKLSIGIAEKIVKQEIESNVLQCLKNQIESCLGQLDQRVPVILRLNPADVVLARDMLADEPDAASLLDSVRLAEDRRVERGGCILETEKGALKATISEQLEKLTGILKREYGKSVTEEMGATPLSDV